MANNRIDKHWLSYRQDVIPNDAPDTQVRECRRSFYAGARGLLFEILTMLDPGKEPTDADIAKMRDINNELQEFAASVKRGEA